MQYRVEFCIADVERVMVALECLYAVAKEQCKTSVDAHRCEVAVVTLEAKPKELREKAGRSFLVTCWNDGVVEHDRHRHLLRVLMTSVCLFGPSQTGRRIRICSGLGQFSAGLPCTTITAASDNGRNRPPARIYHKGGGRGCRRAYANRRATIGSLPPDPRHLASGADQCQLAGTADLPLNLRDSR